MVIGIHPLKKRTKKYRIYIHYIKTCKFKDEFKSNDLYNQLNDRKENTQLQQKQRNLKES